MATPFLSEIVMVSFNFAPKYYSLCNGQILPINQNQALFSLLGTTYGGDGRINFGLPNFQGRIPMHQGNGHTLGEKGGSYFTTIDTSTMPQHGHAVTATLKMQTAGAATTASPVNAFPAVTVAPNYSNKADDQMKVMQVDALVTDPQNGPLKTENSVSTGIPFNNIMPYLGINFIIALTGVFPSRN
ncbi:microcystin-dependent protein [Chitinophaga niastensis]|uniref:Microcystin-dependent protein n=1 Tax=Chitinophaga niastensis TaxID=536980 RepID=A0A2P8H9I3_CHINA|nr:tail fiber protein [Chitinophaga niastensis]PSL42896.1 microcystin-dependent protein [Chitinophaga niastensis]